MNKTNKATHNSKNYNRKRIRRFEGQKVEIKGVFEHYIDDTKIILKNVSVNRRQFSHISLILKESNQFSKNQRVQCSAIVEAYIRSNNTKSYQLRQI